MIRREAHRLTLKEILDQKQCHRKNCSCSKLHMYDLTPKQREKVEGYIYSDD